MNTFPKSAFKLCLLSLLSLSLILHSSSTLSQAPMLSQKQNTSTVEIRFPDEAQIKMVNGSSKTGRIASLDTKGLFLYSSNRIIYFELIKEIFFLKRAHVRERDRAPVLNGGREDIAWRVSSKKIKLKNPEDGTVIVDLAGVLSSDRIEYVRNRLHDKDVICRVTKLIFKPDRTIIIEGRIESTVF
jgi:hypothetical protein